VELVGDAEGIDEGGESAKIGPFLIFEVKGTNVDAMREVVIEACTHGIGEVRRLGMRGGVELEVELADSKEQFRVGREAFFINDETGADQVRILSDVSGSDDAGIVDVAFDTEVLGEVIGSVKSRAFVVGLAVVRNDIREARAKL